MILFNRKAVIQFFNKENEKQLEIQCGTERGEASIGFNLKFDRYQGFAGGEITLYNINQKSFNTIQRLKNEEGYLVLEAGYQQNIFEVYRGDICFLKTEKYQDTNDTIVTQNGFNKLRNSIAIETDYGFTVKQELQALNTVLARAGIKVSDTWKQIIPSNNLSPIQYRKILKKGSIKTFIEEFYTEPFEINPFFYEKELLFYKGGNLTQKDIPETNEAFKVDASINLLQIDASNTIASVRAKRFPDQVLEKKETYLQQMGIEVKPPQSDPQFTKSIQVVMSELPKFEIPVLLRESGQEKPLKYLIKSFSFIGNTHQKQSGWYIDIELFDLEK